MPDTKQQSTSTHNISFMDKISHELRAISHGILGISDHLHDNWENLNNQDSYKNVITISNVSNKLSLLIDLLSKNSQTITGKLAFNVPIVDKKSLAFRRR